MLTAPLHKPGDLVIHEADALRPDMLATIVSTEGNIVTCRYVHPDSDDFGKTYEAYPHKIFPPKNHPDAKP